VGNSWPLSWLTGLADIPGRIASAINGWFAGLVQSAAQPVMRLLGGTVLSTPDLTGQQRVRELWAGSLLIADSLFLLVLTLAGISLMGEETVHTRAVAKEYAPRIVLGFVGAHLSLLAMSEAIGLANGLSRALAGGQVSADGAAQTLAATLGVGRAVPIYLVLIALLVVGLALTVIVGWIMRIVLMMWLAVAGPLMLIWHGLPWTERLAALWWRALGGALAVQVGQTLLILLGTRVLLSADGSGWPFSYRDGLVNSLSAIALFYLAIRLQGWVTQLVLNPAGGGRSVLLTLVRYQILRRVLRAAAAAAGRIPVRP
jgi:hypothetical protein